jgi:hypothetical protein
MQRRDDRYGDPKPCVPPQLPLHNKDETKYRNAIQRWHQKVELAKTIE